MINHNIKIAWRNLMKYKLQTVISILSVAIGIVTLSFVHSILEMYQEPAICSEPYYDRVYQIRTCPLMDNGQDRSLLVRDFKALHANNKLTCTDGNLYAISINYHYETIEIAHGKDKKYKSNFDFKQLYGGTPNLLGWRSAITGEKIKVLKDNECIISERTAKKIFGNENPIGTQFEVAFYFNQCYTFTIVDVLKELSRFDETYTPGFYFCLDKAQNLEFFPKKLCVKLSEGCTVSQLQKEVDRMLKPLEAKSQISSLKEEMEPEISSMKAYKTLTYLAGSLILLAAMIGYLRMQIQLLWMRRREISLRVVNGAKQPQLFAQFFLEVVFVVGMAVVVSIGLGICLSDYIHTYLWERMKDYSIDYDSLYLYSVVVGSLALIVSGIIIWFTISRVIKAEQGLVSGMRNSRTHHFRNVMLCAQVAISMFFACAIFVIIQHCNYGFEMYHVPDDDTKYKETLVVSTRGVKSDSPLLNELEQLSGLSELVSYSDEAFSICNNDTVLNVEGPCIHVDNPIFLDFQNLNVRWFSENKSGLVIHEDLYKKLHELGLVQSGVLKEVQMGWNENDEEFKEYIDHPIGGVFSGDMPFSGREQKLINVAEIEYTPYNAPYHLLFPKAGKAKLLLEEATQKIEELESIPVNDMMKSYKNWKGTATDILYAMRIAAWSLGAVSLIICVMSIYSTIVLDTRTRRKEVAVRKINGAKAKDIIKLFGRVYVIISAIGIVISVPCVLFFHEIMLQGWDSGDDTSGISAVLPIVSGIPIVLSVVCIIVLWQIGKVMKVNPSEIISKE